MLSIQTLLQQAFVLAYHHHLISGGLLAHELAVRTLINWLAEKIADCIFS